MRLFINGNQAIARAAILAGCDFFAGYPITPATSILLQLTRELPKTGGIAIQAEDEIASMGFCIGAALTGKRVMTATSGPGISLYSESISAAIMIEVPMVIVDVQRMGPATGAPTLGGYGDIQFVRWGNSGGFPIIALAPTNVQECFNLTLRAFDLAERFRVPVFVLIDKEIALTKSTVEESALEDFHVREREIANPKAEYVPYESSQPSETQPLSPIGGDHILRFTTSSHTERGYLTKDSKAIHKHNMHLIAKISERVDEISLVNYDHQPNAETLVISYGNTFQAVWASIEEARRQGYLVSSLLIHSLWPIPEKEIRAALNESRRIIIPELNLGLYRREIERLTSDHHEIVGITRLDGGMISPNQILETLIS